MKIIKIEVKSCAGCENHQFDVWHTRNYYCTATKARKTIKDITTIPDWCELEDAPEEEKS